MLSKTLVATSWVSTSVHLVLKSQASTSCPVPASPHSALGELHAARGIQRLRPEIFPHQPRAQKGGGTDCECQSSQGGSRWRPAEGPSGSRRPTLHLASGTPRGLPGTPGGRERSERGSPPHTSTSSHTRPHLTCYWARGEFRWGTVTPSVTPLGGTPVSSSSPKERGHTGDMSSSFRKESMKSRFNLH